MIRRYKQSQQGMTLIEVMVAVAIFAVVVTLATAGFKSVADTKEITDRVSNQLSDLQSAMSILERDIEQMSARTARNDYGEIKDAFIIESDRMTLSRTGRPNPGGLKRPAIQRIQLFVEDNTLIRRSYKVLDLSSYDQYTDNVLIENVKEVQFEAFSKAGNWETQWPPYDPNIDEETKRTLLPKAVKMTIEIENLGKLEKWFRGPQ